MGTLQWAMTSTSPHGGQSGINLDPESRAPAIAASLRDRIVCVIAVAYAGLQACCIRQNESAGISEAVEGCRQFCRTEKSHVDRVSYGQSK